MIQSTYFEDLKTTDRGHKVQPFTLHSTMCGPCNHCHLCFSEHWEGIFMVHRSRLPTQSTASVTENTIPPVPPTTDACPCNTFSRIHYTSRVSLLNHAPVYPSMSTRGMGYSTVLWSLHCLQCSKDKQRDEGSVQIRENWSTEKAEMHAKLALQIVSGQLNHLFMSKGDIVWQIKTLCNDYYSYRDVYGKTDCWVKNSHCTERLLNKVLSPLMCTDFLSK